MHFVSEDINSYCEQHSQPVSDVLKNLAEETHATQELARMLTGAIEGNLLRFLIRSARVERILEIGTFTGYSALTMAEALPENGEIITCDVNPDTSQIAQKYWSQSPHGHKITLKLAPALETIEHLAGPFDLVFIDADKKNYSLYWDACLPKLRSGGIMVVDNVLWSGRVLQPETDSDLAIVALNDKARNDPRVECAMLPVRDGMLLAWKKPE